MHREAVRCSLVRVAGLPCSAGEAAHRVPMRWGEACKAFILGGALALSFRVTVTTSPRGPAREVLFG